MSGITSPWLQMAAAGAPAQLGGEGQRLSPRALGQPSSVDPSPSRSASGSRVWTQRTEGLLTSRRQPRRPGGRRCRSACCAARRVSGRWSSGPSQSTGAGVGVADQVQPHRPCWLRRSPCTRAPSRGRAGRRSRRGAPPAGGRCRRRWSTSRPRRAASGGRRRPSPRAPATARAPRTSTRCPSGRRCRPGRARAAPPAARRRRRRGTRGGAAGRPGRRRRRRRRAPATARRGPAR